MLGFIVKVAVGESLGFSLVSCLGSDLDTPHLPYSYQGFVIHIYCVSAPSIVASGHIGATPA
jgi:hypothetical protein